MAVPSFVWFLIVALIIVLLLYFVGHPVSIA